MSTVKFLPRKMDGRDSQMNMIDYIDLYANNVDKLCCSHNKIVKRLSLKFGNFPLFSVFMQCNFDIVIEPAMCCFEKTGFLRVFFPKINSGHTCFSVCKSFLLQLMYKNEMFFSNWYLNQCLHTVRL